MFLISSLYDGYLQESKTFIMLESYYYVIVSFCFIQTSDSESLPFDGKYKLEWIGYGRESKFVQNQIIYIRPHLSEVEYGVKLAVAICMIYYI